MLKNVIMVGWAAATLLQLAIIIRLILLGLVRRYRWLSAWLALNVAVFVFLWISLREPDLYSRTYPWCMILLGTLECAVTWEAFAYRCAHYGGVAHFGRGLLAGLVALGMLVCLFFLHTQFVVGNWPSIGRYVSSTKSVVDTLLAVFLLSTEVVFSLLWKPDVRRNVLVYCRVFTVLMLLSAAMYSLHNITGDKLGSPINAVLQLLTAAFALAMLVGFRRSGEIWEAPAGTARLVALAKKRLQSAVDFIDDLKSKSSRKR
jgi:hypothetical protein